MGTRPKCPDSAFRSLGLWPWFVVGGAFKRAGVIHVYVHVCMYTGRCMYTHVYVYTLIYFYWCFEYITLQTVLHSTHRFVCEESGQHVCVGHAWNAMSHGRHLERSVFQAK